MGPVLGLRYQALLWSGEQESVRVSSNKAEARPEWGLHLKARLRDDPAAGDSSLIGELLLRDVRVARG